MEGQGRLPRRRCGRVDSQRLGRSSRKREEYVSGTPEPGRSVAVKAKVAGLNSKVKRRPKIPYTQVGDPGYKVLVKGLMQKTAIE